MKLIEYGIQDHHSKTHIFNVDGMDGVQVYIFINDEKYQGYRIKYPEGYKSHKNLTHLDLMCAIREKIKELEPKG